MMVGEQCPGEQYTAKQLTGPAIFGRLDFLLNFDCDLAEGFLVLFNCASVLCNCASLLTPRNRQVNNRQVIFSQENIGLSPPPFPSD